MVETILRNVPESRNSDITLMIEIWKKYYPQRLKETKTGELGVYLKDLYDLPREDGVKRIRASFNHEGKYFPTDWKVAKGRGIKEDVWRQELGYPAKADTANPTKDDSYMDQQRSFTKPQLFNNKNSLQAINLSVTNNATLTDDEKEKLYALITDKAQKLGVDIAS